MCPGLEPFCQDPAVLKKFETMASGKILLAEILERGQTPLVVLYDTSQDDDININAACMKALHDKSLASPLQVPKWSCVNTCGYACGFVTQHNCFYGSPQVNSAYMNVAISSVCSDGTIYCQPPSRALTKMNETLEKIETYFHSQVNELRVLSQSFFGTVILLSVCRLIIILLPWLALREKLKQLTWLISCHF